MTLEELKAAWDAAIAAAKAKPEDKSLQVAEASAKKAYEDAKAEADAGGAGGGNDPDPDDLDEEKLDAKTKALLAKLRKENASARVKNKDLASKLTTTEAQKKAILKAAGIEEDPQNPEEQIKVLQAETQTRAFREAVLESAVQHGIGKEDLEFFEFMVSKATSELGEGEELSDEKLQEIVAKVKKAGKGSANTSVNGGGGGGNPNPKPGASGEITLEKFVRMSITEKSKLYDTNKDLYTALITEAKAKKMLV